MDERKVKVSRGSAGTTFQTGFRTSVALSSTPEAPGSFTPALCGQTRVGLICSLKVESV